MRSANMRRWWLTAHLYFGLAFGVFFVLLGLTGSVLVFYLEIDDAIAPTVSSHSAKTQNLPLQHALEVLHEKFPDKHLGWRIELPLHKGAPIMARYIQSVKNSNVQFAPLVVKMDANTHEILASRVWGDFFVTWIYDLHYTLLLGSVGKTIVAIIGIMLLISLFSGIYLWWPKNGQFSKAFYIKKNASHVRKIYDWHKLAGLSGLIFLLLLSMTGVMLSKPDWFKNALAKPAPLFEVPLVESTIKAHKASLDQVKHIAEKRFPNAEVRWIYTPENARDVFQVRLHQSQEPGRRFPKTMVWIDQYSGEVLATRDATQDVTGDVVLQWLHPLHNGEAFGLTGRWLIFWSGWLPLVMFVTGFLRWRHKQQSTFKLNRTK